VSHLISISEAASLALHTMVLLAGDCERRMAVKEISSKLRVSQNHLAKVLQRLAKAGLVRSSRGPKGGFVLKRPSQEIDLLEVYEAIEGPIEKTHCLLGRPICNGNRCILGGLLKGVVEEAKKYLTSTKLSDLKDVFKGDDHDASQDN